MSKQEKFNMHGLVLTAGGARGAYQAGVLKRIGEISAFKGKSNPFKIITGASAGALNATALAAGSHDFPAVTQQIAKIWSEVCFKDVFRSDLLSLAKLSAKMLIDLTLGGLIGGGRTQSLLDASPLRQYLKRIIDFDRIQECIQRNQIYALAVTATSYFGGKSYTFVQGQTGHPLWNKSRRIAVSGPVTVDHIWASCAIPVVFQPVLLPTPQGSFYFGDGGLRLVAPFSPAIRLGSSHVFAIGVRSQKAAEERSRQELMESHKVMKRPPLAQIFGITLNSMFLDHLDTDNDHLRRMNEVISNFPKNADGNPVLPDMKEPMRMVRPLVINPSQDIGNLAETFSKKMPGAVRYFMEGLGTSKAQSADLMSYMLFDDSFAKALIDMGYRDAAERIDEIESFLNEIK